MSFHKPTGLVLFFLACGVMAPFGVAKSDIINNGANTAGWWLNSKNFSDYPIIPGSLNWVNLADCGPLTFTAGMEIGHAFTRHTLNVWLKRDGVTMASESKKVGPSFGARSFTLNFPSVGFSPGEWAIQWQFLDSVTTSDSASIKLVAPIKSPQPPPYDPVDFCGSGSSGVSNNLCRYQLKLPTGFIYNNSYYITATNITSSCPAGQTSVGGGLCRIGMAPAATFVEFNSLYYRPIGSIGTGFPPNKPPFHGGYCIQLAPPYDHVVQDFWGCLVTHAPYWQQAVAGGLALLLTERKNGTCSSGGTFDGANCYLRSPPPGSTALDIGGVWYWTPQYCK
jgi:hypothetical protein